MSLAQLIAWAFKILRIVCRSAALKLQLIVCMTDHNLVILGARLRTLRKDRGLSQEKLAERAEVHRNFIGFIERGERNVGVRTLVALGFGLGVHPSELLAECPFENPLQDS